jgi:hypothetical protein
VLFVYIKFTNVDVFVFHRYSYAIVGINITGMAYKLLKTGALRTHFYNCKQGKPTAVDFNDVYCKYH